MKAFVKPVMLSLAALFAGTSLSLGLDVEHLGVATTPVDPAPILVADNDADDVPFRWRFHPGQQAGHDDDDDDWDDDDRWDDDDDDRWDDGDDD